MIATVLIAAGIVAADFAFYPFGLEAAALVFYSIFSAGQRLFGIGEQSWMIGGFIAGAIVLGLSVLLFFETRAAAVDAVARWSLFTLLFDAKSFLAVRIDLRVIYVNVLVCFAASALLPALIYRYTHANLRNHPFKDTTQDVERMSLIFIAMLSAGLLLKFHHMVAPLTPQVPSGLPRPKFYVPSLDVYADDTWIFVIVAGLTFGIAMLSAIWPLLIRRVFKRYSDRRKTP